MEKQFMNIEIEFINKFKEGFETLEEIVDNSSLSWNSVKMVAEQLTAKGIITFDTKTKKYKFTEPLDKDKTIVLSGNILLPVSIIKRNGFTYINRGTWYKFEGDIDIRNIIWNVELPTKNNRKIELVELVKNSVLKVKKSKIVQVEEYKKLQNVIIPWNNNIHFKVITVGEEATEVQLMFVFRLGSEDINVQWRDMSVRTLIKTEQLLEQLYKKADERVFSDIELNRIYNKSDFIFANNCFPVAISKNQIKYLEISAIRGKFELTEFVFNQNGSKSRTGEIYSYNNISEGINFLSELFDEKVLPLIEKLDFMIETEENN